jgi:hypothetical protein
LVESVFKIELTVDGACDKRWWIGRFSLWISFIGSVIEVSGGEGSDINRGDLSVDEENILVSTRSPRIREII